MVVSTTISGSRVFLFLGAGASAPFGGWLMGEFIVNLMGELSRKRQDLYDLLAALVSYKYIGYDLEAILKELGDICDKQYLADKSRLHFINNFLDPKNEQEERYKERDKIKGGGIGTGYGSSVNEISGFSVRYGELVRICMELRTQIEIKIFEHYGNLDNSLVVKAYTPILDILSGSLNEDKILPVFTTNYDRVIEDYGEAMHEEIELVDGFKVIPRSRKLRWDRNIFDDFRAKKDKLNIVLFKLHGSIYWDESNEQVIYSVIPTHRGTEERFKNVLIYPAMNKIATRDPYFTGYDYFQRCLDNTDFAVFIGYSFRDYDTVTKIKSALNFNDKLILIVLAPDAKELVKNNFSNLKKRFITLQYSFGEKGDIDKYLEQLKKALEK